MNRSIWTNLRYFSAFPLTGFLILSSAGCNGGNTDAKVTPLYSDPQLSQNPGNVSPSPLPVSIPSPIASPVPVASPDGTTLQSTGQIIDSKGNSWTLSASGKVLQNGNSTGLTSSVSKLLYHSSKLFGENSGGRWWVWNGSSWDGSTDPSIAPTAMIAGSSLMCVDVPGGSALPGQGVQQSDCNASARQAFTITSTGDGFYLLTTGTGGGNCLDSGTGYQQVVQSPCDNTQAGQKWKLLSNGDGTYAIQTSVGPLCLNVNGSPNGLLAGATMITFSCTGHLDETFQLPGAVGRVF